MKSKGIVFTLFALVSLISLSGCAVFSAFAPTSTPVPTYTPYPTYTPFPTATEIPTATATATERPTATPTVTPTRVPYVAPTATTGGSSKGGGSTPITWANETSHTIKIVAVGAVTYTVNLAAHQTVEVHWNSGYYEVYYYLDGSSSAGGYETLYVDPERHYLLTLNFR